MEYFDFEYAVCFMHKCCGCCKHFIKGRTIVPDFRASGMGGNEVTEGLCDITGHSVTNRTAPCKKWSCQDGVIVALTE